jgi:hypothetical protein
LGLKLPFAASTRRHVLAAALLLALGSPSRSFGKDMGGRLGIGFEQSTTGVSGLAARYWPIDYLNVSLILGFDVDLLDQSASKVAAQFQGLAGLEVRVGGSQHANWTLGVRVGVGYRSQLAAEQLDPPGNEVLQVNIEVPLRLEFYLSDNFSFGVAAGGLITIVPFRGAGLETESGDSKPRAGTVSFGIGAGQLSGSLGVTYYF